MSTINTPQGQLELLAPPADVLRSIRSLLPFGIVRFPNAHEGAHYGLVMQCGDKEVYGVKQQPVPCDKKQGRVAHTANSILIAHSIAGYLRTGFSGVFMPSAYVRKKDAGMVESGIAYFGAPSPQGIEAQSPSGTSYDRVFGSGFTTMMTSFIHALKQSSRDTRIGLFQPIGLDVRPRLHFGTLGFGFMVVGPHVVCLKCHVSEQDPVWTVLRGTGICRLYHLPSVPLAIEESQLPTAKPSA
jgi:hypothetical protein